MGRPDAVENVNVIWGETGVDKTETFILRRTGEKECLATLSASIVTTLQERAVICGTKGNLYMPKPHMAEGFTLTRVDGTQET